MRAPHRRHDEEHFYKYHSAATAKIVLSTSSLRWSSPQLFNDPFDVPRTAELNFTTHDLEEAIHAAFVEMLHKDRLPTNPIFALLVQLIKAGKVALTEKQVLESLRDHLKGLGPVVEANLKEFRQAWEELVPRMRILCMSAVNNSPPMWAHYCDAHRGVVLQLDSSDERDSSLLLAERVTYRPEKPQLPGAVFWAEAILGEREINWQEYFRDYFYVKRPDWGYEQEWRVISYAPEGQPGLFEDSHFDGRDLSAVYLGAEIAAVDQQTILAITKERYPHTTIYKAVINRDSRAIEFILYE